METQKIQLVARHLDTGREVSRQQFEPNETERADRIMIARNRVEQAARLPLGGFADSGIRWGIETAAT